ncbi:MAG: hypothetical protein AB7S38_16805 [Vulcanimicrobiota bacterium]
MSRRGILLLEAVLAIFVVLIGVVLVASMLQQNARQSGLQGQGHEQIALGEQVMAEIRDWANDPNNFRAGWAVWNGRTVTHASNSSVAANVVCDPAGVDLSSPSSELEANWPGRERVLARAVVPVEVTVQAPPLRPLRLLSYIPEPPSPLDSAARVTVTVAGATPVPQAAQVTLAASLTDAGGNTIDNLSYQWFLQPETGNASLMLSTAPRRGQTMDLLHELRTPGIGVTGYAPGTVRIRARARYFGQIVENGEPPEPVVNLQ